MNPALAIIIYSMTHASPSSSPLCIHPHPISYVYIFPLEGGWNAFCISLPPVPMYIIKFVNKDDQSLTKNKKVTSSIYPTWTISPIAMSILLSWCWPIWASNRPGIHFNFNFKHIHFPSISTWEQTQIYKPDTQWTGD